MAQRLVACAQVVPSEGMAQGLYVKTVATHKAAVEALAATTWKPLEGNQEYLRWMLETPLGLVAISFEFGPRIMIN